MSEETTAPKAPDGWVPLPIDVQPIWSPDLCKRPVQGAILNVVQFGPRPIDRGFIMKLDIETDAVSVDGLMHAVPAGAQILVPLQWVLTGLATFVQEKAAQGLKVNVWIGTPTRLPVLGAELYGFEVRVNPVATPR